MPLMAPESKEYKGQPIKARECLARLRNSEHQAEYQVFDLIEGKPLGQIKLDSELELSVPLTGVRAVKLTDVTKDKQEEKEQEEN